MSFLNKFRQEKEKKGIRESLLEHLNDLLNTKRGFGSYPTDLGLDSYVYLGSDRKIILQIMADIKHCFEKYERRIREVEVSSVPNESRFFLSFIIKCKIENKPHAFQLSFQRQNKSCTLEVDE